MYIYIHIHYIYVYIYIYMGSGRGSTDTSNGMVWISVRGVGFEILESLRKTSVLLSEVPEILKIQRKIIVFEGLRFQNIENPKEINIFEALRFQTI